jgi:acetate---CoA ligase (ADP-forming) subunit beta
VTDTATHTLSEYDSKRLLASVGVPVLDERLATNAADAVAAAREVGAADAPVVLKLCGEGVAHKTERGLVRLGLRGDDEVREAAEALLAAARPDDGDVGVLVAPLAPGNRELIAGVHRDPQFGPCVMIGLGGVLAEALGDVAFRLAPVEPVDAEEMLDDLSGQAVLGPFRGDPRVDRAAVTSIMLALSRLAETRTEVMSVDVNPLVVVEGKPVAVDALVEVSAR